MNLIDTHSHLYAEEFDENRDLLIHEAIESGIDKILLPNIDSTSVDRMFSLCDAYPVFVFPMMGLHPTSVDCNYEKELEQIQSLLEIREYCAIGEIGIDLYWDKTYLKEQEIVFEEQLRWAVKMNLPVAIHTREAFPEVLQCIHNVGNDKLSGVFHSFTGNEKELDAVLELNNFKIGINGVVTYKNTTLREILKKTSIDKIVLETDAPYLPPVPYRGKANLPIYIWKTAEKIAEIFGLSVKETVEITRKNTLELFKIVNK